METTLHNISLQSTYPNRIGVVAIGNHLLFILLPLRPANAAVLRFRAVAVAGGHTLSVALLLAPSVPSRPSLHITASGDASIPPAPRHRGRSSLLMCPGIRDEEGNNPILQSDCPGITTDTIVCVWASSILTLTSTVHLLQATPPKSSGRGLASEYVTVSLRTCTPWDRTETSLDPSHTHRACQILPGHVACRRWGFSN